MDPRREPPQTLTRTEVLRVVTTAFSRPDVLVRALQTADSDDEAVQAVSPALDLGPAEARAVLDQRFRLLTRANVDAMRCELDVGCRD